MKKISIAVTLAAALLFPAVGALAQTGGVGVTLPPIGGIGASSSASTTVGTTSTTTNPGATTTATTSNDNSSGGNGSGSSKKSLKCSPVTQTAETGTAAVVKLSGGNGTYSLSAPGYTVINTENNVFTFTYRTPGTKYIIATSGNDKANCTIEVTGTSLVAAGATEADQVTVIATQETSSNMMWPWVILAIIVIVGIVAYTRSRAAKV